MGRGVGVMHYAKKHSARGDGYRHLGRNRAGDELSLFTFSTFTFNQGQNTEIDQKYHVQRILYTFLMNLI